MYRKEVEFRDYTIVFDYSYHPLAGLYLTKWNSFIGNIEEPIPCVETSSFIEKYILNFLDEDYKENGDNYHEEYLMYLEEKRASRNECR